MELNCSEISENIYPGLDRRISYNNAGDITRQYITDDYHIKLYGDRLFDTGFKLTYNSKKVELCYADDGGEVLFRIVKNEKYADPESDYLFCFDIYYDDDNINYIYFKNI